MAKIKLSVVSEDASISEAVDKLHASGKSAVVVQRGGSGQVLAIGDLMTALHDDPTETAGWCVQHIKSRPNWLADMAIRLPTAIRSVDYIALPGAEGPRMLGSRNLSYGKVVAIAGDVAQVQVSRSEFAKMLTSSVIICKCDKDHNHKFFPSQVTKAGQCNYQDGGKLTCK